MRDGWPRKRAPANHTDDWLMTYADMITLLLCFFVIFLSVSIPRKDTSQKLQLPQPVTQPSAPTELLNGNQPYHGLTRIQHTAAPSAVVVPVKPAMKVIAPPPVIPEIKPAPVKPAPKIESITLPETTDAPPAPLPIAEAPLQTPIKPSATLPEIIDRLKAQGTANIEQKGDRITTINVSSAAFFDSGSAGLSASGKSILQGVAANLKSDKFRDYQITVEGHTDDAPIATPQFPSNWELSTARASAVVHFFLEQGIAAQKLRAAGYADTFPIVPNRDANGNAIPENQARNRRVVIKLEKIEKTE